MLTLYPEQEEVVQRMLEEPTRAVLNASSLGTGKTVCTVELVKRLDAKTVLLIGPLNVDKAWKKTFEGQNVVLPFSHINSTKAGLQAFADLKARVPASTTSGVSSLPCLAQTRSARTARTLARLAGPGLASSRTWRAGTRRTLPRTVRLPRQTPYVRSRRATRSPCRPHQQATSSRASGL